MTCKYDIDYVLSVRGCKVPYHSSPAAIPSEPQSLTITVMSSSSITVEWLEPDDDGGDAAIDYTITLQGGPGAGTSPVSSLSTTFTRLVAPNTYNVTVAAVNSAGPSQSVVGTISFRGM